MFAALWFKLPSIVRFSARRLVIGALLCLGVTLVSFTLIQVVPGDPVVASLGDRAASDPAIVAAFKARFGLDKPVPEQYLIYVTNLLRGDMGESLTTRRPVSA